LKFKKISQFKQFRQYLLLLIAGLLLIFLAGTPIFKGLTGGFQVITVPIQTAFYHGFKGIGNTFSTFIQIGKLRRENSDLTVENSVLKSENLKLKDFEKENENLRQQLGTKLEGLKIVAAAHPVGKGVFGSKNIIEIDVGEKNNVKVGDLVIYQNIFLGEVVNVTSRISSVQILSDPDTKIPAVTAGGAEGLVEGEFGSGVNLTNVVQEQNLNLKELVYTSGKGNYPRSLVIGEIEKVNKIDKELFQKAVVKPLVKIETLELVYVVSVD